MNCRRSGKGPKGIEFPRILSIPMPQGMEELLQNSRECAGLRQAQSGRGTAREILHLVGRKANPLCRGLQLRSSDVV
jgi:hypothetical protein